MKTLMYFALLNSWGCLAADHRDEGEGQLNSPSLIKRGHQVQRKSEPTFKYHKKFIIENKLDSQIEMESLWAAVSKSPLEVFMVSSMQLPIEGAAQVYSIEVDQPLCTIEIYFRYTYKPSFFEDKIRRQQCITLTPNQDYAHIEWLRFNSEKDKLEYTVN